MSPLSIVSLLAAGWLAQAVPPTAPAGPAQPAAAQGKPVSANLRVRIATNTYMPDGRVLSASASDWPLKLNEPVVAYAASGKTICEPKPATSQPPDAPSHGWWVEITPVREGAGELEVRVRWRQHAPGMRLAGKEVVARGAFGGTFGPGVALTLHPGDRIVLDYLGGGPVYKLAGVPTRYFAARRGLEQPGQPGECAAIGISLEIGLEPAKTDTLVEAELWLVRRNKDGTERSDRQVLRLPVGHPASRYFFDEARLADTGIGGGGLAKVSGELSAIAIENGKIRLNFNVMRRYGKSADADTASTYRDLVAAPGEVLAFKLPAPGEPAQPPLSIRLRANVLR